MTETSSLFQIDVSPVPAGTRITTPPTPLRDVPASDSDYRKALPHRFDGTNRRTPLAENSSRDLRDAATQYALPSPAESQAEDHREASTDDLDASRSSSAQQQAPGRSQPAGDSDDASTNEPNTVFRRSINSIFRSDRDSLQTSVTSQLSVVFSTFNFSGIPR